MLDRSGVYADGRKIEPGRRPDNTPDDDDRVEIGPTALAYAEWAEAGLTPPDLPRMRAWRHARIVEALQAEGAAGVLLFDPLNIRYATDTTNMQLWTAHNPYRACLVLADGWMVLFEYGAYDFLSAFNPLVREVRDDCSFFYFVGGERSAEMAGRFAAEVDALVRAHGGGSRKLAVDKIMLHGLRALEAKGLEIDEGERLMEHARVIKGPDEVLAMRCAMDACVRSIAAMREASVPGAAEVDAWAVLHAENIRRGGEWIETRLLASGPRTNPWFQECGPRVMQAGELLAFDTDLIGSYGMCVDISRTWLLGDGEATAEQRRLHRIALEFIQENEALVRPGVTFHELCHRGAQLAPEFLANRYCRFHGVGLCDEWPLVKQPVDWDSKGYDGVVREGMMLCVEVYIGAEGGREGVKLEDQLLVTETGVERMSAACPYEPRLL